MSHARPTSRSEHGFSLVELVVAMVVLLIVMGMVMRTMTQGMGAKDSAGGGASVSTTADQAMERLSSDLRTAQSPGRVSATEAEIAAGVRSDGTDIADVFEASTYSFQIRADVDQRNAGTECVQYRVDTQGSLWRVVKRNQGCGNAPADIISAERLVLGFAARNPNVSPSIFSIGNGAIFNLANRGNTMPSAVFNYERAIPDAASDGSICNRVRTAQVVSPAERAQVIAVTLRLNPVVQTASDISTTVFIDTIAVRSRSGLSYRRAIGCSDGVRAPADANDEAQIHGAPTEGFGA